MTAGGSRVEVEFTDLDAIRSYEADGFGEPGPAVQITQSMVDAFAELTDDHQWIHVDVERASAGPYGGTIAHGFLTLVLLPRYGRPKRPRIVGHRSAINFGAESLRFLSPVPVGSSVAARRRIVGAEERSGGTLVTTEIEISVVGAAKPAVLYRMQVLYR